MWARLTLCLISFDSDTKFNLLLIMENDQSLNSKKISELFSENSSYLRKYIHLIFASSVGTAIFPWGDWPTFAEVII